MISTLLPLDPVRYQRHPIHGEGRIWAETNCYVDLWVELLHAWGFEPVAALPFTLALDFEGDQWTFFKFPLGDLDRLFGLDVQELALWRPLVSHVEEQVRRGRPVLVELDSYYLPDTAGTAYRQSHVKTTVGIVAIDVAGRKLGYFHNAGYYQLAGEDFAGVFRLHGDTCPAALPPYAEFVKRRPGPAPHGDELVQSSLTLLRQQLRRLPSANPFEQFKARFEADQAWLMEAGMETFHAYSFATLRQFGACYELAATYLRWLQARTGMPLDEPSAALSGIATGAKALQFRLARSIAGRKPLDLAPVEAMARAWHDATERLRTMYL